MPRIRKKTSRRQSTQQRAKIHRKAGETKRKNRKESKKNPQWKSKKKADPGIPNSFPFKDQILAEVAAQRRLAEEEKIARKERGQNGDDEVPEGPGISSLASASVYAAPSKTQEAGPLDEIPQLVDTSLATLQDVLDKSDIVCQVLDARDIDGSRNLWIEKLIKETDGSHMYIINKADLVPREVLEASLSRFSTTDCILFSAPQSSSSPAAASSSSAPALDAYRAGLLNALASHHRSEKPQGDELVVSLMGLPSVGKTSIFNALLPSNTTQHPIAASIPPVSSAKNPQPTTRAPIEVSIQTPSGKTVKVIDTPGWDMVPDDMDEEDEDMDEEKWDALEDIAVGDVLRRNMGRVDRIKDVLPLASWVIERSNAQDLMVAYNVPFFEAGDVEAFLTALARVNNRMKKGETPDLEAAARILLRDWATNQFPYYSVPTSGQDKKLSKHVEVLKDVLELSKTRKELRSQGRGLIRFKGGEPDQREIILDDDYTAMFEPSDDYDSDEMLEYEDDEDLLDDDLEDDEGIDIDMEDGSNLEVEDDEDVIPEVEEDEAEEEEEELMLEAKAPKKGKGKKVTFADTSKPAPKKSSRNSSKNKRKRS